MKRWALLLSFGVLLLGGCSTTSMKGTPFYTGEYEQREGPAADRVNLWPLLYYRDPALSVLWPLMEFSPEHQAVRPLYSGYDLDTGHPVYNVLWPISRFDLGSRDYRIFPVYWGSDYFNVLPLYWHAGEPLAGTGHDALFPLWIWRNEAGGNSLHLAWPFYALHRYDTWNAWHLWPLYGMKQTEDSLERDVLWPLGHTYTNSAGSGSWLIPAYSHASTDETSTFLSLPYSRSLAQKPGGDSWDLALPLWYRSWKGEYSNWMLIPALSGGSRGNGWSRNWFVIGLGGLASSPDRFQHYMFPMYYYNTDPETRSFYTLPWWRKMNADGSGFSALVPFYYHGYSDRHSSFYSLPWLRKQYADGTGWHASFPLYYRGCSTNAASFYSLPWFSNKRADGSGWHTTVPLYYRSYTPDSSAFYSLVWMSEQHPDDTAWQAAFPVYYGAQAADGSVMITPLYARKRHADESLAWRCFIPLVYVNEDYDAHFMTLLGGRWRLGDRQNWYFLPLLSGGARNADTGRNIYLAGLAGQRWNETGSSHYVFPFYYRAPQDGTFASLPYVAWNDGERQYHAIPPLLSGWYAGEEVSRGLIAAGLAGFRSGGEHPCHYVFPLYYSAPMDERFISLPYATWCKGDRRNYVVPPLLSGWHRGDDSSGGIFALGLAGYRKGAPFSYQYLFPFYYAAPEQNSFLSLPYATWASGTGQHHTIPLLLSGWSASPESTDYLLLGGLGYWRQGLSGKEGSHLVPFYMWSKERYFYSVIYGRNRNISYFATPLAGRYENGSGKSGGWLFPFFWHRNSVSTGAFKGYYFPLGYYGKNDDRNNHGFMGIYDYDHRTVRGETDGEDTTARQAVQESRKLHYLLSLGESSESWTYAENLADGSRELSVYAKKQSFFPLWYHKIDDNRVYGSRLETSSLLGFLYDTKHEQDTGGEQAHDYFRRRVLWRLYHCEKLNGDTSVDVFPAITVDTYRNGYHKFSILWHLFRYEKDPENGKQKLDLLFIPLKR